MPLCNSDPRATRCRAAGLYQLDREKLAQLAADVFRENVSEKLFSARSSALWILLLVNLGYAALLKVIAHGFG